MMKILLAVLLFASLAYSQTLLVSGESVSGTIGEDAPYDAVVDYYWIPLPLNVKSYSIDATSEDGADGECLDGVNLYWSTRGFPCGEIDFEEEGDIDTLYVAPCENTVYGYVETDEESTGTFYAGYYDSSYQYTFNPGANLYLGVAKDFSLDSCVYTLTVTVTTCSATETSWAPYDSDEAGCESASVPSANEFDLLVAAPAEEDDYSVTIFRIPVHANNVWAAGILINQTADDGFDVYDSDFYVTPSFAYAASDDYTDEAAAVSCDGDWFEIEDIDDLVFFEGGCLMPPLGDLYITFQSYVTINATVEFGSVACADGWGGYNCSQPVYNSTNWPSGGVTIKAATGDDDVDIEVVYPGVIYYVDVANGTEAYYNITVTRTSGSGIVVYRKDGFPTYYNTFDLGFYSSDSADIDSTYSTVTVVIRPEDTMMGGRFYVAILNTADIGGSSLVVDLSVSAEVETTESTTGTTTGGVEQIVAPLMMIIALIALLL